MILKYLLKSLIIALMLGTSVYGQDYEMSKIEQKAKVKYLTDNSKSEYRYRDNTSIESADIIDGNVVVVKGDLVVYGTVDGDILVLYGDIKVKENAVIKGNATTVNGHIHQDRNSKIEGNQIETRAKNLLSHSEREDFDFDYDYDYDYEVSHEYDDDDWEWTWSNEHYGSYGTLPISDDDSFILRYNRVQGAFLGLSIPKSIGGKYNYMTVHGFAGYGFENKKWDYRLGLDRWLFNQREYRFEIGAKIYDLTDSQDEWLVSTIENTFSSAILKNDYHDFYRRTGYDVHISQNYTVFLQGKLGYRNDEYESVEKNAKWALLNKKDKFRVNPTIDEGNIRSIYGEIYLDTRDNTELPKDGWFGLLAVESSTRGALNSDYFFNQYNLELRRYQHFGYKERIDIRLKLGSAEGVLPSQKQFQIGGVSTLRGFRYKSFEGDRMFLANLEYNLNPRVFSTDFLFFDELNYVVFYDMGNAWDSNNKADNWYEGFDQLTLKNLKSDIGLAITFNDGEYRVNFAKRLDTGNKPFNVTFRIVKPF